MNMKRKKRKREEGREEWVEEEKEREKRKRECGGREEDTGTERTGRIKREKMHSLDAVVSRRRRKPIKAMYTLGTGALIRG